MNLFRLMIQGKHLNEKEPPCYRAIISRGEEKNKRIIEKMPHDAIVRQHRV